MSTATEVQVLLRFLSKDAKIPLATAMAKVKELRAANLNSPEAIANTKIDTLIPIFEEEKQAKQVLNAAKRSRKATSSAETTTTSPAKRKRGPEDEEQSPAEFEESLALPESSVDEAELAQIVMITNRAPLVLAFAVVLLKYTMPEQPVSARLSLAQAVVSANSRSKAVHIGLESGKSAEDEGWGQGQPVVKVMGREIRVLKRWGYEWKTNSTQQSTQTLANPSQEGEEAVIAEEQPALWGLDLEALKKSNGPAVPGKGHSGLPIFTAQSAHQYLLKSFHRAAPPGGSSETKPKTGKAKAIEQEQNLGMLLKSLDILIQSWSGHLEPAELDRRAWSWYVRVRPDVKDGIAGWGGKGEVKLAEILDLQRRA